jgi:MerR family transcriptional regulator, light-induced transcriptional regulator
MSNVRQLVDYERWPVVVGDSGWSAKFLTRARKSPWNESRRRVLEETVEREIVPRLLRGRYSSHELAMSAESSLRAEARPAARPATRDVTARDVAALVRLVSAESMGSSLAHVERIRARGVPLDAIFLHLLAPAAHLLGEMWVNDTADFATVTIATSRLQQILRELAPEFHAHGRGARRGARALFVAMPGDQHTFGVSMLQEFFRHDGWTVSGDIPKCCQDVVDVAGSEPFRLIGISASCDTVPDALKSLIAGVRRTAVDPKCKIMVAQPELARFVGADSTATDAQTATRQLSSLLDTKAV